MESRKLQLFMDKAVNEELFRRRMEQASSLQEALGMLKSEGLEMEADEFRSALRLLLFLAKAPSGELGETDLDSVSGGVGVPQMHQLLQNYNNVSGLPGALRMASILGEKFLAGHQR